MQNEQPNIPDLFPTVEMDDRISCIRKACDLQIHYVISFAEKLDEQRLARALRLSLDAEPVLGCRLIEKDGRQYWQRRKDLDTLKLVEIIETDQQEDEVHKYLVEPLDLDNDPLVQARLLRADSDTLCIKVNHIVADAAGVKEIVEMVANIYTELGNKPSLRPLPNIYGCRSVEQILRQFGLVSRLRHLGQLVQTYARELIPPRNWHVPYSSISDISERFFVIRRIDKSLFLQIVKYAKSSNCTVNDILVAAFYRALYAFLNPSPDTPLRLGTTVNLRRYLPSAKGEAITNLAAMFYLNIGDSPGMSMNETIRKVNAAMAEQKKGDIGMGDKRYALFTTRRLSFEKARKLYFAHLKFKAKIGPKAVPPLLTNMGPLEIKHMDFAGTPIDDAYLTPPLAFPPAFICGISGFDKSFTFSVGFCEPALKREAINDLLSLVEKELSFLD